MAPVIKNVAIAGTGGNVGAPALKQLVQAGFNVLVLIRTPKPRDDLPAGATAKTVDFSSVESLTNALQGQDAIVDATSTPGTTEISKRLIDAAVAAGVYRIIPPEFSGDPNQAATRALPPFAPKAEVYEYLKEKTKGTKTTWTTISNQAFLDWCMRYAVMNIDIKKKKVIKMYDGNYVMEWTLLESVAKAIVGALKKPAETENLNCYIHSIKKSQNQMVELAKDALGADGWQIEQGDLKKAFVDAIEALQNGKFDMQAFTDMIRYGAVSPEFAKPFPEDHNELLGVPTMSDEELKDMFKQIASE
ncbi:uncharacterized protein B0J16DRAFT_399934 [Fusarium flagelliforme]|uniref:uncharacterized protein n=1 Tax=Fusarium flagelliforme TaxID=2675880 RepID=UPI001E8CDBD1|nr:uncharacterized protein B0J16DRAFT_399934 [Fusarium flagelliforme]KAH7186055.1 hypothetical protein B0J16DRAFT_399934 [Fusarium flagelliforme]